MPPKRKRAEADLTTARTTRQSTRTTRAKNGTADNTGQDAAPISGEVEGSKPPPSKKPRATTRKLAAAENRTTGKGSKKESKTDDNDNELEVTDQPSSAATATAQTKVEYTPQAAQELFKRFADDDDPDVMGPSGVEKLCTEAGIALDGAEPLILAWQFKAQEMAKLTRAEWLQGTEELRIASLPVLAMSLKELDDLVVHDKEPITPASSQSSFRKRDGPKEPYNRSRYWRYASDRKSAFTELYQFCFHLAKPAQSRNLDIETAMALWSVLLGPRYPVVTELTEFLNESGSYKGANKDIWNMVHEFCVSINLDLTNFEADGAWPTMIDEFVAWKRSKMHQPMDNGAAPKDE